MQLCVNVPRDYSVVTPAQNTKKLLYVKESVLKGTE